MKQNRTTRALLLPIVALLGAASWAFVPARPSAPDRAEAHAIAEQAKGAVVAVLTTDPTEPGEGRLCSGVLVGPNLVLTARHCVAKSSVDAPACDAAGQAHDGDRLEDVPASRIAIYTGDRVDLVAPAAARVKEVVHSGTKVVCDSDIAYLVLEAPIANAQTLKVRTHAGRGADASATAASGDQVVSIGYGGGVSNELGVRAIRDVRPIAQVGPFEDEASGKVLGPREMEIAGATCQGDSGGPAIDVTRGDVVAVASRGAGCTDAGNHVFTRVESFDGLYAHARAAAARAL